ncbi:MAG: S8 family serine peptidase, partial [Methanospirillum sp.]|nr:S8 family serine peptidase [Methanospirillum sp.]
FSPSAPVPGAGQNVQVTPDHAEDRVIVRYNPASIPAGNQSMGMESLNEEIGASVVEDFSGAGMPGMQVVQVQNPEDAISEYLNDPRVLYAEPDYVISLSPADMNASESVVSSSGYTLAATPNDPYYSLEWGLHNTGQSPYFGTADADIDAPGAWDTTTGASSVVVAVVDTGVDYTHPDLSSNIWANPGEIAGNGKDDDGNGYIDDVRGWNFYAGTNDPMDNNGHGTHCAGIISATGNNGLGIAGTSWTSRIMPLKFLSSSGKGSTSGAISAILYASRMGAHVISNSWGGTQSSQSLKEAIEASSAVVVCAAGNGGNNTDVSPVYPASYSSGNIISVGASDYTDKLASFSNYGPSSVDLVAPGLVITSTYPSKKYVSLSGTSMAVPFVSGAAVLVKAVHPSYSNIQIKSKILDSVDAISSLKGKILTGGRLNAANAIASTTSDPVSGGLSASFSASPVTGKKPLTTLFTDLSSGKVTKWSWNFGDGGRAYTRNPRHVYYRKGTFTVTLTVSNLTAKSTCSKQKYITVT